MVPAFCTGSPTPRPQVPHLPGGQVTLPLRPLYWPGRRLQALEVGAGSKGWLGSPGGRASQSPGTHG